jgi:hypothetical protein
MPSEGGIAEGQWCLTRNSPLNQPLTVIPAKAGTQGCKRTTGCPCSSQGQALDPRFRVLSLKIGVTVPGCGKLSLS